MTKSFLPSRRIAILRDDVSRKIAAGEVIDRPFSIVRELLDNAIDAGSSAIDVYVEAGGISRVRVVDDGAGMDKADLELCWRPHATSKILSADDLLTVTSLGFRGEALSSIAVAARLEIVSAAEKGLKTSAHRLSVQGGKLLGLEPCQGKKGTTVDVSELFFDYPARRKFLKGASAEAGLCRTAFVDKALTHPGVSFRLYGDGALKLFLPPQEQAERIAAAVGQDLDARILATGNAEGTGFAVRVVAADPGTRRRDRRLIQVFVNRRRVPEFSLMQAVEFGFSGFMPGGWYPVAFVFVDIDPSLVDFNIHPAKKEVRFRALPDVHSAVVRAVRDLLGERAPPVSIAPQGSPGRDESGSLDLRPRPFARISGPQPSAEGNRAFYREIVPAERVPAEKIEGVPARFLGQAFGVFLVFEMADRLLFLDQHAAHERLLFERISATGHVLQQLLIPVGFDVSEEEGKRAASRLEEMAGIGIVVRSRSARTFEIVSLAPEFSLLHESDLVVMVQESFAAGEEWQKGLRARAACRLAIKEGDPIDPAGAAELLRGALALKSPRCPHGRPIWYEMTRTALYGLVDRTP
jgi:DNA mismatch repair protein MutL